MPSHSSQTKVFKMNKNRHLNFPSGNILPELFNAPNGNPEAEARVSNGGPLGAGFIPPSSRLPTIQETMPSAQTNICDSSILNLAIERTKGVAFKQVAREPNEPRFEVTTRMENLELSQLGKTAIESKGNAFKPRIVLKADDARFTPVDVAKGPLMILVTSPMSNQVGVFQDGLYTGTLDLPGSKYFNKPRNVLYIPRTQSTGNFLILDESGVRVFTEGGKYLTTLLKGDGYQYRGLAYYQCWRRGLEGKHSGFFLVMLRAKPQNDRNLLCIFQVKESFDYLHELIEVQTIPISEADGDSSSRCRFVSVSSSCALAKGCLGHLAFVTDVGKSAVYKINLTTGQSCTALLEGDRNLDATFADVSAASRQFSLISPTGITVDTMGNIYVADKDSYHIEMFAPTGLYLRSLRVFGRPLGIEYDDENKFVLVVDQESKTVAGFKFSLGH